MKRRRPLTVDLSPELRAAVFRAAEKRGESASEWAAKVLIAALPSYERKLLAQLRKPINVNRAAPDKIKPSDFQL